MPSEDLISKLEEWGESTVRSKLATGEFGSTGLRRTMVEDWLNHQFLSRAAAAESRKQIIDMVALIAAIVAATAATIGAISSIMVLLK